MNTLEFTWYHYWLVAALLARCPPSVISLAAGNPNPDNFPFKEAQFTLRWEYSLAFNNWRANYLMQMLKVSLFPGFKWQLQLNFLLLVALYLYVAYYDNSSCLKKAWRMICFSVLPPPAPFSMAFDAKEDHEIIPPLLLVLSGPVLQALGAWGQFQLFVCTLTTVKVRVPKNDMQIIWCRC